MPLGKSTLDRVSRYRKPRRCGLRSARVRQYSPDLEYGARLERLLEVLLDGLGKLLRD